MRKVLLILFFANALFCGKTYASHLMGGEVTYQYLDNLGTSPNVNRYKVRFEIYGNCDASSSYPTPANFIAVGVYYANNGNVFATYNFNLSGYNFISPNLPSGCSVSGLNGFCSWYATYEQIIEVPVSFSGFYVAYSDCCRNASILNLSNPGGAGQTIYTKIPATAYNNNSPVFSDTLIPYLCKHKLTSFVNTAIDPDGDRLVYSFTTPYDTYTTPFLPPPPSVAYATGYSLANPFGTGGYAYINATSGLTTYQAPNNGRYVISIQIKEYRKIPNGTDVLLNTTNRELQFIVGDCPVNTLPALTSSTDSVYDVNAGSNLCFNISYMDSAGDHLTLTKNGNPLGNNPGGNIFSSAQFTPSATLANASGNGTVSSQFCWNTNCNQAGTYLFRVNIADNGCPPVTIYKDYTINVIGSSPPGTITGPNSVCENQTGTTYSVAASAGSTFQWTITGGTQVSGGTSNSIVVNWGSSGNGSVSVVKINAAGCASTPVNLPVAILSTNANAGPDVSICFKDSTTLNASGGSTYSWTPVTGLSTPNSASTIAKPLVTTTYFVNVTGSNGCSDKDTVVVTVIKPVANAGIDKSTCSGVAVNIGAASVAGYTYSWSPSTGLSSSTAANPSINIVNTGTSTVTQTYILTATLSGCTTSDTVIVTVKPFPVANAGNDVSFCSGSSAALGTTSTPGYTYLWSPVTGLSGSTVSNPTVTLTNSTTNPVTSSYIVTTSLNGCSTKDTVNVTVKPMPVSSAGPDVSFCSGSAVALGTASAPGYTYSWSPSTGLNSTTISNPTVTLTNTGTSAATTSYVVTSTLNGCVTSDTVLVTVKPYPVANAGSDVSFCSGSSAALGTTSTTGYTYSWSPATGLSSSAISNPTVTLTNTTGSNVTTSYIVTTSLNGCPSKDTAAVTVRPLPVSNAGPDVAFCSGNSIALGTATTTGYTYSWSPSSGLSSTTISNPTVTLTNTGTSAVTTPYIVTSTLSGCVTSDTVLVTVKPYPIANAGSDVSFCSGSSAALGTTSTSGYIYLWSPATGLSSSAISNPTVTLTNTTANPVTASYIVTTTLNGCSSKDTVNVTVRPLPVSNAGPDVSFCSGNSVALGTASTSGYTYSWSPPAGLNSTTISNPTVTLTNTGASAITTAYIVTSTLNGCVTSDTILVTVKPYPVANAGSDVSFCSGSSATLGTTSTTGYTYLWSPVTGLSSTTISNPAITLINATTNPVTGSCIVVTTLNGCSAQDTVDVTVRPLPVSDAGTDVSFCSGDSAALGAATTPGYTYSWSPATGLSNSGIPNPTVTLTNITTNNVTTAYIVTSALNGCTTKDTVLVTVKPYPVANAGNDVSFCSGSSASLGTTSTSGYIYSWSPLTGLSSGTISNPVVTLINSTANPVTSSYVVTTSLNGCTSTDTVNVTTKPMPVSNAGPDVSFCSGNSAALGTASTPGYAYSWTPSTGLNDSAISNPAVTLINSGTSAITSSYVITSTLNGCVTSDTVLVTVKELPQIIADDAWLCPGDSITLNATGGVSYAWSPSSGLSDTTIASPIASPSVTTTYTVVSSGINSCFNSDTITVAVTPKVPVFAGVDRAICKGDSTQLGSTPTSPPGSVYLWRPAAGLSNDTAANPIANPTITTTYTVYVANDTCSGTDTVIVIVNPLPSAYTGNDTSICLGQNVVLGSAAVAGNTYSWTSFPAGFVSGSSPDTVSPAVGTIYYLNEIVTATGCSKKDSIHIGVLPLPNALTGNDTSVCDGAGIVLGSSAVAGNTYQWTSLPAGFNAAVSQPADTPSVTTTYYLTETNSLTGCKKADSVTIIVIPIPAIPTTGSNSPVCEGDSIHLSASSASGGNYNWTGPSFISSAQNPSIPNASSANAGTYSVTTTVNGCTSPSATVSVVIHFKTIVNAGANQFICKEQDTIHVNGTISGTSPQCQWISLNGTGTFIPNDTLSTTQYLLSASDTLLNNITLVLLATNNAPCPSSSDTLIVTIGTSPVVNAGSDQSVCSNQATVHLNGTITGGAGTAVWTTGNGSGTFVTDSANNTSYIPGTNDINNGTVTLIYTSTNACINKSDTMVVAIKQAPVADFTTSNTTYNISQLISFTDQSTDAYNWYWIFGTVPDTSHVQNPVFSFAKPGYYPVTLTVTDNEGCLDTIIEYITVRPLPVAVASGFSPNGDNVNDVIYVKGGPFKQLDFRIYNEWGNEIFISNTQSSGWNGMYNGVLQPVGVYVYTLNVVLMNDETVKLSGVINLIE